MSSSWMSCLLLPAKQVLTFSVREVHRFNLYQDTEAETKRFAKWVDKLPKNTIVGAALLIRLWRRPGR